MYAKPFKLIDIITLKNDKIIQCNRMALLELIQKHIYRLDI
ncbi:MAG: Rpn family recombination-promoting nuclease/putative transposase [Arsenophonus sp. NC-PG7-MAG3]